MTVSTRLLSRVPFQPVAVLTPCLRLLPVRFACYLLSAVVVSDVAFKGHFTQMRRERTLKGMKPSDLGCQACFGKPLSFLNHREVALFVT